ncbi:MAG: response regulator [Nitrospirae bacterium]|nr:response regulator [Nitrospirota bacterium]
MEKTVLVVVNDLFFRSKIRQTLEQGRYTPLVTHTEEDALQAAREHHPCLVLLDLGMQTPDPLELIAALKGDPDLRSIPVLAFISHVDRERLRQAEALGCARVVARSEFSSRLPELVDRLSGKQIV